eukprot:CAMPEP_0118995290 /NCGR_PEP_ID=MMETSP1173-20130426/58222_1 /TAXON_ID=1034831 /ORGANISM="Rhizochromulina marina cf, Strain CCMP1243" /LENGTH=256 /DNA_ID=CAMNT_0006946627 /DNA_START=27 /DNA_END=794 /DNA_ORIENTATION=-
MTASDPAAAPTLEAWARAIESSDGTASFTEAVAREAMVVSQVSLGVWSAETYHEYQRMAAVTGNVDSAHVLLHYGVAPSLSQMPPLLSAAAACRLEELRALLGNGVLVDTSLPDGTTALVAASLVGCEEAVRILLAEGADVEVTPSHGATPLMVAAMAGYPRVVRVLAQHGANVTARHRFAGSTSLHLAAELSHSSVVRVLCQFGVEANATTMSTGGTALHTAVDRNASTNTLRALVRDCGVDLERLMHNDTTALY